MYTDIQRLILEVKVLTELYNLHSHFVTDIINRKS